MNKKSIVGAFVCVLILASIPLMTGVVAETNQNEETTDLIGFTWLRGWIFNPKSILGMINARAIRLHYFELTGMETHFGIVRIRDVTFRDGIMLRYINVGPLGSITYVIGITYGGINIQN